MKILVTLIVVLIFGSILVDTCQARGRLFRRRSTLQSRIPQSGGVFSYGTAETAQERAQAEADYMAANRILCHVGSVIGTFEGVGRGARDCNTCVPGSRRWGLFRRRSTVNTNMTLVADAVALGIDDLYYRVRGWR